MSRYSKPRKKFTGCDEDCFNCKYRDCLTPASQIKRDDTISGAVHYIPKAASGRIYSSVIKINEGW